METPYVDLGRGFRELTEEQAKDPDALDLISDWEWRGYSSSENWSDLEKRFRTIVLAEAGSGKTREMQERCNALKQAGKFAFFLPLELLERDEINGILESDSELDAFQEWVSSSNEPAWLFLDALDELKLRDGIFKAALINLKKAIRGSEMRARIIVSCRPHDWYLIDGTAFFAAFPPPALIPNQSCEQSGSKEEDSKLPSEERFLRPLRKSPGSNTDSQEVPNVQPAESSASPEKLAIYKLLALREAQIERFIRASSL